MGGYLSGSSPYKRCRRFVTLGKLSYKVWNKNRYIDGVWNSKETRRALKEIQGIMFE